MTKKNMIIAAAVAVVVIIAAIFGFSGSTSGVKGCSVEEYTKKTQEIQTNIVALQQKDPAAFQKAMEKMQEIGMKMSQNPTDFSAACVALDEIAKLTK